LSYALLEISDRTKQKMVTKFYRVKINAVGAVNANPKNRTESRGAADFTNH
jgi:hypothetical protein